MEEYNQEPADQNPQESADQKDQETADQKDQGSPVQLPVLLVYTNKSVLIDEDGNSSQFDEGTTSSGAKKRLATIKAALTAGFLTDLIEECKDPRVRIDNLTPDQTNLIEGLVDSVTSEIGRGLVGLTVLQLTVKAIIPEQSIRLHKAGVSSTSFSWREGIPMRNLDKFFITPVLRHFNLLKLNSDGFMMTRTLAENYPYSKVYKAAIKGAREEWVTIVEEIESGELDALNALKQLIVFLYSKSEAFVELIHDTTVSLMTFLATKPTFQNCYDNIVFFIENSNYSARIFEIAMHSFFQVLEEEKHLDEFLKPLSQMRSANKKHGNIGDIEVTLTKGGMDIKEAWDAKYGKTYLRDELEELDDKLRYHAQVEKVGFVTNNPPDLRPEITDRLKELSIKYGIDVNILSFKQWVDIKLDEYGIRNPDFGAKWLTAILESIGQKRREIAPIDEPTTEWVKAFKNCIESPM